MIDTEHNDESGPTSSFVDPAKRVKAVNTRKAGIALRMRLNIPSPLKAIRDNCLECAGGSPAAVRSCGVVKCRLWPYRFGRNPKRDDLKSAVNDGEGKMTGQTDYPGYPPKVNNNGGLK